ncbi:hypothetical protein AHAS_Ahas02G0152300 [Arachis hypogaea]
MDSRLFPYYYCVFEGWLLGIYTTTEYVHVQIEDYENSFWRTYDTMQEAYDVWLVYFDKRCP